MATYLLIRDDHVSMRVHQGIDPQVIDGKLTAKDAKGRVYFVDGKLAEQDGLLDRVKALAKERKWDQIDPKYLAGPGLSESGLLTITESEWSAQQAAGAEQRSADRREKLEAAIPGITELQAAVEDELRYDREFQAMMEDEDNDGARPPKRPTSDVDAIRSKHPRAAAYIKAGNWELASHHVKSSEGRKAKERLLAGDDVSDVLADMDHNWTEWCMQHVD